MIVDAGPFVRAATTHSGARWRGISECLLAGISPGGYQAVTPPDSSSSDSASPSPAGGSGRRVVECLDESQYSTAGPTRQSPAMPTGCSEQCWPGRDGRRKQNPGCSARSAAPSQPDLGRGSFLA